MGYHADTLILLEVMRRILNQYKMAITVRQLFYRLVAGEFMENNEKSYRKVCRLVTKVRKEGYISPESITDRTRRVYGVSTWENLQDFLNTVKDSYAKDLWQAQDCHVELWLEKEALGAVFEPITNKYRVNLCITKGRPSFSYMYEASKRLNEIDKPIRILYFGDFDPTGEAIYDNLVADLKGLNDIPGSNVKLAIDSEITIQKIALSYKHAQNYPQAFTKESDPNTKAFVEKYGDIAVELDAIPPNELAKLVENSIIRFIDRGKMAQVQKTEADERKKLEKLISKIERG